MEVWENRNLEDLDGEIWKEISGYDGDYFVSNLGRVKSFKRYGGTDVRILEQSENSGGYLRVCLHKKGEKPKPKHIHILMYEVHIGKIPEGCVIHHIDENKINNIFDNFQMMTNEEHISKHNSGIYEGENNPNVILTEQDVIEIRELCDEGILTQKEIGEKFGVSNHTISKIKLRKTWKHLK